MLRTCSIMLAAAAFLLTAIAGYHSLMPSQQFCGLSLERTETDFGALPPGEHRIVVARVKNSGGSPARILGISESCQSGVCYEPVDAGPIIVPPGETVDIMCQVTLHDAGPVGFQVHLYLDNGAFDHIEVRVSGIVTSHHEAASAAQHHRP